MWYNATRTPTSRERRVGCKGSPRLLTRGKKGCSAGQESFAIFKNAGMSQGPVFRSWKRTISPVVSLIFVWYCLFSSNPRMMLPMVTAMEMQQEMYGSESLSLVMPEMFKKETMALRITVAFECEWTRIEKIRIGQCTYQKRDASPLVIHSPECILPSWFM